MEEDALARRVFDAGSCGCRRRGRPCVLWSVLLYGTGACTLLSTDTPALRVFERKVLHKIFNPVRVGDDFSIRYNSDQYELFKGINVVRLIVSATANIQHGSAMLFLWRRMLWEDGYLMGRSAEVAVENDLVSVGRTKSIKPCH